MSRELDLARTDYCRCLRARQSALHLVANLARQLAAARLKRDAADISLLAEDLRVAENGARMAAADLASAKRVVAMMGG
jgi:hypothetical protein